MREAFGSPTPANVDVDPDVQFHALADAVGCDFAVQHRQCVDLILDQLVQTLSRRCHRLGAVGVAPDPRLKLAEVRREFLPDERSERRGQGGNGQARPEPSGITASLPRFEGFTA